MAKQKLTTEEILAQARQTDAQGSGGGGEAAAASGGASGSASPAEAASVDEVTDAEPELAKASSKNPAAKPASTADILAAARAQKSSGTEEGAGSASKSVAKPASTSDVLAAARDQGSGGGAAKKPVAKPGSTSDILAAARAAAGGSAKQPTKPATGKASPKTSAVPGSAAPRPAGDRPSVQEMVKAAREGAPAALVAAKPKLPSRKPASSSTRRSFFGSAVVWVTEPFMAAWVAMGAIAAVWGLATARFMMPNMIVEPPTKFKIGPPSEYPPGTVSAKWKAARGIWIVNTDQYDGRNLVYALSTICTHLGCTPNWLEGEQKFKCPCHGSGFYITGINFEGPAPRPLERMGIQVAEDGSLEIDKSVKYQEELGQWQDPASFVELA